MSAASSCSSIYTGTISVYGHDLKILPAQAFLQSLLDEVVTVQSKLTSNFGVTRLAASSDFSKVVLLQRPAVASSKVLTSPKAKFGLALCVILVFVGFAVTAHFLRIEHEHQSVSSAAASKRGLASKKPIAGGGPWNLFHSFYHHVRDCDAATHASSLSSRSAPSRTAHNTKRASRKKASSLHHMMEAGSRQPVRSVQFEEPDSIYIVEPDEDDDNRHVFDTWYGEYGVDPLSSEGSGSLY